MISIWIVNNLRNILMSGNSQKRYLKKCIKFQISLLVAQPSINYKKKILSLKQKSFHSSGLSVTSCII